MRNAMLSGLAGLAMALGVPAAAQAADIALWKMDEPHSATTMQDSAGAGGANNGAITSVETGAPGLVSGKSYRFTGEISHVTVPDNPALDPGSANMTVEATVKVKDRKIRDDSYDIIRKGITTTRGGEWKMEIKRDDDDKAYGRLLCVFKGSSAAVQRVVDIDIADGKVHNLKCVKTANSVQAVVDGRVFTNMTAAGSIANDEPVVLGSKVPGDDVFHGRVDEVRISIG